MRDIIDQVAAVPGVVGTLVYGPTGEVLSSAFPSLFEADSLRRVAAMLAEDDIVMGKMVGPKGALDLRFAGGRVVVKPVQGGALFVLCTSALNPQLLNLSLTQATRRLEKVPGRISAPPPAAASAPAPAVASAPPAARPAVDLTAERAALVRAVTRQIGPIGEMVVEQAFAAWSAQAAPSRERLPKLVEALAQEIDEGSEREQFRAEAAAIVAA